MSSDPGQEALEEGELPGSEGDEEAPNPASNPEGGNAEAALSHSPQSDADASRTARKKKRAALLGATYYDIYGSEARAQLELKAERIRLEDVQGLILWVLGQALCPSWVFLKNKPLVRQVVLLMAPGLNRAALQSGKSAGVCRNMEGLFGNCCVTQAAASATIKPCVTVSRLLTVPWTKKRRRMDCAGPQRSAGAGGGGDGAQEAGKKKRRKDGKQEVAPGRLAGRAGAAAEWQPPFPPEHYLLTASQLQQQGFPGAAGEAAAAGGDAALPEGYATTQPAGRHEDGSGGVRGRFNMVAMDCEMVKTEDGLVLARLSLVDEAGEVLMDELCQPDKPVLDYLTQWSGITAAKLQGVEATLPQLQERLLQLLSADTLLVGHSLENDLHACKLVHSRVLDTSLLYPHPKGPPWKSALRILASRFLRKSIHQGSHDSVQDAAVAMELALKKLRHGPSYGTARREVQGEPLTAVLSAQGCRCCLVDRQAFLLQHTSGNCSAVVADEPQDRIAKLKQQCSEESNCFLWTQLPRLSGYYEERASAWRQLHQRTSSTPSATPPSSEGGQARAGGGSCRAASDAEAGAGAAKQSQDMAALLYPDVDEQVLQRLARLDDDVGQVADALKPNTLLLVVGGQGDTALTLLLQEMKRRCDQGLDDLRWSGAAERRSISAMDQALESVVLALVKQ